ncbi:MAG: ribosome maturation factor RimP [Eubacteriales bacterium]|nr:ribosome maturation factor RimP [Eubacteriales bacterium]
MHLQEKVKDLVLPVVEDAGCELVDVEFVVENRRKVLRLLIDKSEGVGIDDCTVISQAVEPIIDDAEIMDSAYDLEVSSPGLDRPLITEEDLNRNKGRLVDIILKLQENGRNSYQGSLKEFDNERITIILDEPFIKGRKPRTNGQTKAILKEDIKLIKRAIRF